MIIPEGATTKYTKYTKEEPGDLSAASGRARHSVRAVLLQASGAHGVTRPTYARSAQPSLFVYFVYFVVSNQRDLRLASTCSPSLVFA
jgi:hypothetical protein